MTNIIEHGFVFSTFTIKVYKYIAKLTSKKDQPPTNLYDKKIS